jgi:hypothetical protein
VFFLRCIGGILHLFVHLLPTAEEFASAFADDSDGITANVALIDFTNFCHSRYVCLNTIYI